MSIEQEITFIANQLAKIGKKPTVALIKKQLVQPATLPQIISVLKSWSFEPNFQKYEIKEDKDKTDEIKQLPEHVKRLIQELINEAIQPLNNEIKMLKSKIEKH